MAKKYIEKDVLQATNERFDIIFNEFDNIYFSVSGGKDSSIMFQLACKKAREHNKKISILYIDLEAQYKATIDHVIQLKEHNKDVIDRWYWICMPLSLRNAVSVIQPKWICWDEDDRYKWVRDMPQDKDVVNIHNYPKEWTWFKKGMEFEDFIIYFAEYFNNLKGGITACGVGIRADESLNRYRTIVSDKKNRYKNYGWTTNIKIKNKPSNIYNFYPIYDWRTEDDWTAVANLNLDFNEIYELMYKNGLSIHEQRLCQPYGDDQRNGLDQFRALEPETWEKVLNRVHGVNYGNIYARTSLLGNITTEKPSTLTWEQYTVFLLESLGLYSPELKIHYYHKIKVFMDWYKKEEGIGLTEIPQEADLKEESQKKVASWRRIARAIEKNDFWLKRLSFGQTKSDVEKIKNLKLKYKDLLFIGSTRDKDLNRLAESEGYKDE